MEFLVMLGGWVMVWGIGVLVSILRVKRRAQGAAEWPKVIGAVTESGVYAHPRHTQAQAYLTYTPVVEYTYTVAGMTYTSRKVGFAPAEENSYPSQAQAQAHLARYPLGREVAVYYNPHNPRQAVLKTKKPVDQRTEVWFGVLNVVLGGGVIVLGLWLG